ncbi:MAG: response regulator [Verrucomicrobiota bacterium]
MSSSVAELDPTRVFLYFRGNQKGPMTAQEAERAWRKDGTHPDTLIWSPGLDDWTPALEIFREKKETTLTLPEEGETVSMHPAGSPKVLTVDDDPIMLEILQITLSKEGYHVVTAKDMLPACQILEAEELSSFDCVVTDYSMPGGTGLDLIRWVKQRDESLQALILSAKDDKQLIKEGLRAGIFDFLEKPLVTEPFLKSVHAATQQTTQRREERQALLEMIKIKLSGHGHLAEEVVTSLASRESSAGSIMKKLDSIIKYSQTLEEGGLGSDQMQGKLGDITMLDLTQLLIQASKTGRLKLKTESASGSIYFKKGVLYHAIFKEFDGIEALRHLLRGKTGTFRFKYSETSEELSIAGDPTSIVLMIGAEIDEEGVY